MKLKSYNGRKNFQTSDGNFLLTRTFLDDNFHRFFHNYFLPDTNFSSDDEEILKVYPANFQNFVQTFRLATSNKMKNDN